jgi:hypothetical protein
MAAIMVSDWLIGRPRDILPVTIRGKNLAASSTAVNLAVRHFSAGSASTPSRIKAWVKVNLGHWSAA